MSRVGLPTFDGPDQKLTVGAIVFRRPAAECRDGAIDDVMEATTARFRAENGVSIPRPADRRLGWWL